MNTLEKKVCPDCNLLYEIKSLSPAQKENIPLFLKCGHSLCENCIVKHLGAPTVRITCKICKTMMEVMASDLDQSNSTSLYKTFPINTLMLGELVLQNMKADNNHVNHKNCFINLDEILQMSEILKCECLKCKASTKTMCKECLAAMCDSCFKKKHANFMLPTLHHLQPIETTLFENICKVHEMKEREYYCMECDKDICVDCELGGYTNCRSHISEVISMSQRNEHLLCELIEAAPKVDEVYRRLTRTAVDVGRLIQNIECEYGSAAEYTKLMSDVEQHFSKLYFTLNKHKNNIKDIIQRNKSSELESLNQIKCRVGMSIKKAMDVLNSIEAAKRSNVNNNKENLAGLMKDAILIVNTPWNLDVIKRREPPRLEVNNGLHILIDNYIYLEGDLKTYYNLLSTNDSRGRFILPPPDNPVFPPKILKNSQKAGSAKNSPFLTFHYVHGENIRILEDGSEARRVASFCKGLVFSARPVRIYEKVCIRLVEMLSIWRGLILRFGFTTHDPATLAQALPDSACPDLINKQGYWIEDLGDRFCEKNNILHYYVNSTGDVHFGINREDKGVFFSGVDTTRPLWALVDVFGKCSAVQFVDPLTVDKKLPLPKYQGALTPLNLHRTKGRNVQVIPDRGIAARREAKFCQGYVFTARPIRPGQTIVIQILATESTHSESLAIGLTSCDPEKLRLQDLPDDVELFLDRPEYWVVRRDAASGLLRGDELAVTLTLDGKVTVSRNGSDPVPVMHVDHTLRLWAFFDVYGMTQEVRLLTSLAQQAKANVKNPKGYNPSTSEASLNSAINEALNGTQCTICYEFPIDSVLYKCGHMCMCYKCSVEQWQGQGGGKCPLCRAYIKDVIRTYKP